MEETNPKDWSRFTVNIPLDIPAENIIDSWSTPKALESWFLRLAEFSTPSGEKRKREEKFEAGDSYRWLWYGWPDSVEEHGKIMKPDSGEFLRFQFGKAGIVGVRMVNEHGQNILRLTQEQIPQDEDSKMNFYVGCKTGWTFYLLNLKSILLGGPDLRNKRSNLHMD